MRRAFGFALLLSVVGTTYADSLNDALERVQQEGRGDVWLHYEVEAHSPETQACCSQVRDGGRFSCRLQFHDAGRRGRHEGSWRRIEEPVGSERLHVFAGFRDGALDTIAIASAGCMPDPAGQDVREVGVVAIDEPMPWLIDLIEHESSKRLRDEAFAALVHQAGSRVDRALDRWARRGKPRHLQQQSLFWLGAARRQRGFDLLDQLRKDGALDSKGRDQLTFAFSLVADYGGADALIAMARQDADRQIRGQALFWLGQVAGRKATAFLRDRVDEDPEIQVKEQAVFALSQLPEDESVPILIDLARNHPQPRIREKAMFWLGQSGSEAALAFFEEILEGS